MLADQAGPFENQIHLFYDDEGLREIVLKVRGEAKAKAKESENP